MDFTLDATQIALQGLAREIFETHATHERLKQLEAGGQSFDRELWEILERAGLTSVGVEEGGFLEQCVVLIEQGRTVAPVPLWSHYVGNTFAKAEGIVTVAADPDAPLDWVPAADAATTIVVTDGSALRLAHGRVLRSSTTTAGFTRSAVEIDETSVEPIDGDPSDLRRRAMVAMCALGVGVAERALELTASYTSERKQFDRPLGSFQAVQQRAADAYIDVEAMRWTMWQAAWRISEGLDADHAVGVAKFWAAEAGQRVVSSAQHLHGGLGADIDYPLHRYTLWAKEIELAFGGATPTLAALGAKL